MTTSVRTLVILRHARAEPGTVGDDHVRALALEGRKQASAVGQQLQTTQLQPEIVLCSSALRTRQTWDLVAHGLAVPTQVEFRDDLYAASVEDLLAAINAIDHRLRTVLVVGHEPGVSAAASLLAGPGSDEIAIAQVRVGVPTASYSVLKSSLPWDEWQAGSVTLTDVVRA